MQVMHFTTTSAAAGANKQGEESSGGSVPKPETLQLLGMWA
jgi:hypothetical protein